MTRNILTGIMLLVVIIQSCREEYYPQIEKYEDILVVDGLITNEPGPYEIRLSQSSPISRPELIPYAGAQVMVVDNLGNEEIFAEVSKGVYKSVPDGMQGVVGRKYKVIITTKSDQIFESDFQELKEPTGISNVYAEIENYDTGDPYYPAYGYQFYVDSEASESDSTHLMWRLTGTYKYQADYYIRYYYYDYGLHEFPDPDSLYTCYNTEVIQGIYTFSTAGLSESAVIKFPLNYVTTDTRRLSIRYSLLVKQFTLTDEAYTYYNSLQAISAQQGALYAQQPYQVQGNIKNTLNPDDPVLGYFLVAGIDQQRIYVDRPPADEVEFYYGTCVLTDADFEAYGYIRWTDKRTWPLYVTTSTTGRRALPHQDCVDCRRRGGTIEKPEFWSDK